MGWEKNQIVVKYIDMQENLTLYHDLDASFFQNAELLVWF